uniref:Uncharacterized protein n=1 Tax=Leersia perrieri TaxID=77586 RepID=A0A0D9XPN3_9ORYZ
MTTTTAHAHPPPQPPFPPATAPAPAPAKLPHRRHHATSSSTSSSSLSTASSSASTSPSPSPRRPTTTTVSASSSVVPFSWEHHPGIPKSSSSGDTHLPTAAPPLPLPPHLRRAAHTPSSSSRHHHRRRHHRAAATNRNPHPSSAADPFAAALAECTRDRSAAAVAIDDLFRPATTKAAAAPAKPPRRWSLAAGGVVGLLDLYGCKSAMAVADGAFVMRRPVAVARPPGGGPGKVGQGRAGRAGR